MSCMCCIRRAQVTCQSKEMPIHCCWELHWTAGWKPGLEVHLVGLAQSSDTSMSLEKICQDRCVHGRAASGASKGCPILRNLNFFKTMFWWCSFCFCTSFQRQCVELKVLKFPQPSSWSSLLLQKTDRRWCLGGERLNGKEWRRSMDFISKGSINPSLERSLRSQLRLVEMYLYKCHFPDEKVFQGM